MTGNAIAEIGPYVALASFVMNLLIAVIGATWGIAKIRAAVTEEMTKHKEAADAKIAAVETRLSAKVETALHDTGEALAEIRTKINEVELWARDNFVRRESFTQIINEWRDGFRDLGTRVDRRLERIENLILGRPNNSLPPPAN